MQYAKTTTKADSQTQKDTKQLFTIISNSANPNKTVELAAALIKKIIDARLTTEELVKVKDKATELIRRRRESKENAQQVEIGEIMEDFDLAINFQVEIGE